MKLAEVSPSRYKPSITMNTTIRMHGNPTAASPWKTPAQRMHRAWPISAWYRCTRSRRSRMRLAVLDLWRSYLPSHTRIAQTRTELSLVM